MYTKRIACLLVALALCLSLAACGAAPTGTYTDDSGMVSFSFTEDTVTASAYGTQIATGTYTFQGGQVKLTFDGEFAEYLNGMGGLTYDAKADTLTDEAGAVLQKAE